MAIPITAMQILTLKKLFSPGLEPRWQHVSLCDNFQWMSAHYLKLNLDKTELLFLPGKASPIHDLSINIELCGVPQRTARNLSVTLDYRLFFTAIIMTADSFSTTYPGF